MRVRLEITSIEHDAGAPDGIIERAHTVSPIQRHSRERAKIGVIECGAAEHAQRADHAALDGESRAVRPPAHPIEV